MFKHIPQKFQSAVLDRCPPYAREEKSLHGIAHWRRVSSWGRLLSGDKVAGKITDLFALFHDSQRLNDYGDQLHGARAATFLWWVYEESHNVRDLRWLRDSYHFSEIILVATACTFHTAATPFPVEWEEYASTNSPKAITSRGLSLLMDTRKVTQICYDADRLDIHRVGMPVDKGYLFTPEAKEIVDIRFRGGFPISPGEPQ